MNGPNNPPYSSTISRAITNVDFKPNHLTRDKIELICKAIESDNFIEAKNMCLRYSNAGDPNAMYLLGMTNKIALYKNEFPDEFLYTCAISLFLGASAKEHLESTYEVAMHYFTHDKDEKMALQYFEKLDSLSDKQTSQISAAHLANVHCALGMIYENNDAKPPDPAKAHFHYNKSSELGNSNPNLAFHLGYFERFESKQPKLLNQGVQRLISAARKNQPDAHFYLGFHYSSISRYGNAAQHFLAAHDLNYPSANRELEKLLAFERSMGLEHKNEYNLTDQDLNDLEDLAQDGDASANFLLGKVCKQMGYRAHALTYFQEAHRIKSGTIYHRG